MLLSFAYRLVLLIVGTALGLLLLEVGSRLLLPPPQIISVETTPVVGLSESSPGIKETLSVSLNDSQNQMFLSTESGIRLRPNSLAVVENHATCNCRAEIRTNFLGFRNPPIAAKTRPRVLFLGDSITLADYIPEPDSWVRQIQTLSEATAEPLETINAGIWAIGLANELSLLVEKGIGLDPDLVVLGFYLNDVENSPGVGSLPVAQILSSSWAVQYLYLFYSNYSESTAVTPYSTVTPEKLQHWRRNTAQRFDSEAHPPQSENYRLAQAVDQFFFDWGSAFSYEAWAAMKPLFVELKRLSQVHGFKLAIVAFPQADQVYFTQLFDFPQQQLKAIASELDIPLLDLLPKFRQLHRQSDQKLFYDWCHHTPLGNQHIAQWVFEFLPLANKAFDN